MVKRSELQARKDMVLALAIGQYIKTVAPVSSAYIANETPMDCSSATIRNIFMELEEDGFLTHPHTSAGRIPTQKGYRYYVDHLMHEIQLLEEEKLRIKEEYEQESFELEALLENTSRVLAEITHYTSIISVDGWGTKLFCQGTSFVVDYPEVQDTNKIRQILAALEEKRCLVDLINQDLEKKIDIFIGHELVLKEINSCALVISKYRTKRGPTGRLAVLGPVRMDYERVVCALDYFSRLMEEV